MKKWQKGLIAGVSAAAGTVAVYSAVVGAAVYQARIAFDAEDRNYDTVRDADKHPAD